jgi:TDG/mug DNA glycosylase family protein
MRIFGIIGVNRTTGPAGKDEEPVPDVIGPGLKVLFCGINPGLYSAAVGHHFARPGNRFWPALHQSGFTDRQLAADEDQRLVEYGLGITNVVGRGSARASDLSDEELQAGGRELCRKLRRYRPACLAALGIQAYRTAFGRPKAKVGPQPDPISGVKCWALPNPSGINAHYQLADFVRLFRELRRAVERG